MDNKRALEIWESVYMMSLCVMSLLSVLGNLVVIVTIIGTRKLRNVNSALLLNLGLCDLFHGLICIPMMADCIVHGEWHHSKTMCKLAAVLTCLFSVVSMGTITVIALDRYLSIIHCLKYSSWCPKKSIAAAILSVWGFGIATAVPSITGYWGKVKYDPGMYVCLVSWDKPSYAAFRTLFTFAFPITVMAVCYFRIICVARTHARKITDLCVQVKRNTSRNCGVPSNGLVAFAITNPIRRLSTLGLPCVLSNTSFQDFDLKSVFSRLPSTNSEHKPNKKGKAMIRLLCHILAFVICWILFVVKEVKPVITLDASLPSLPRSFLMIAAWLLCLHSTWNPFIYALVSWKFRKYAIKLITGRRRSVSAVQEINRSKIFSTINKRKLPSQTGAARDKKQNVQGTDTTSLSKSTKMSLKNTVKPLIPPPVTVFSHVDVFCDNGLNVPQPYQTEKSTCTTQRLQSISGLYPSLPSVDSLDEGVFIDDDI